MFCVFTPGLPITATHSGELQPVCDSPAFSNGSLGRKLSLALRAGGVRAASALGWGGSRGPDRGLSGTAGPSIPPEDACRVRNAPVPSLLLRKIASRCPLAFTAVASCSRPAIWSGAVGDQGLSPGFGGCGREETSGRSRVAMAAEGHRAGSGLNSVWGQATEITCGVLGAGSVLQHPGVHPMPALIIGASRSERVQGQLAARTQEPALRLNKEGAVPCQRVERCESCRVRSDAVHKNAWTAGLAWLERP